MAIKKDMVLLDLGGVVFQSTGQSNDQINWEVITSLNYEYGHQLNIGEDVFGAFMADYNQMTSQALVGSEFLRLVFDTLEINLELINLLRKFYRIIIVSDNYRENISYISKRYHFADWSERQFYSFDFKLEKAHPLFFPQLLEELQVKGEELVLIDDSENKIASAQTQGISGILYKSNEQVEGELRRIRSIKISNID